MQLRNLVDGGQNRVAVVKVTDSRIKCMAMARMGSQVAIGDKDGNVTMLTNIHSSNMVRRVYRKHDKPVRAVALESGLLASCDEDTLHIWSVGESGDQRRFIYKSETSIRSVAISRRSRQRALRHVCLGLMNGRLLILGTPDDDDSTNELRLFSEVDSLMQVWLAGLP